MQTSSSPSQHSSITLIASSTDSSSSFQSPYPSSPSKCIGLNLLVKAIHQVTAGSVVGVPYIQRRIITRRRRPIQFNNLIINTTSDLQKPKKAERERRVNVTMPWKYRDYNVNVVVQQPLTPKTRSERRSSSSDVDIIGD